ncbi:MAG: 6,7-dimethyl-8-ribityllumazine synthase [Alphaproteobacteria bacterium]|nr:6,7-dimethyl-8-ribityllumazine synthase [Alphaproteobacteria bacterium]
MEQTPLPDFSADEIALLRWGGRVAIIKADFYHDITNQLTAGAGAVLKKAGLAQEEFSLLGALEIPPLIAMLHERKKDKFDIYVALGCGAGGNIAL